MGQCLMRPPSVDLGLVFDRHPHVYLGFSGGKDSTALAERQSQAARDLIETRSRFFANPYLYGLGMSLHFRINA
jgi:predicted phosphoadenosine phosphosulfate sulfurtransferase